jgi:ArsR family transcriptional regulator
MQSPHLAFDPLLDALRAVGEPTRLRLICLLRDGELTVGEIAEVLSQSQPRVSRHLKLLADAGLIERLPEGAWVFYRLAHGGGVGRLLESLFVQLPAGEPRLAGDRQRLAAIRARRAKQATEYFRANAQGWDRLRALHIDEAEIERVLVDLLGKGEIDDLLDIGTGTGRVLALLGPRVARGVGLDNSSAMLAIARAKLAEAGLRNCHVRHGDMYDLPWPGQSFDAVTIHQVLHFAERPAALIGEAARMLRPGGRLVIVDFAPHALEALREEHAHRRLGFADREVLDWLAENGLVPGRLRHLKGTPLTVSIWDARRPALGDRRGARDSDGRRVERPEDWA